MANRISVVDGNWTAASTWATVDSTALVTNNGSHTNLTTSNLDSAAFAPGAIAVDGVALKLSTIATTPAPTNTITVTLRNSTDSVDIVSLNYNVSDLPAIGLNYQGGWIFFKFDTTYTLTAGKNYIIRLKLSATASQPAVSFMTNGTANNWQHMLRIPGTTGAPAAGDDMHIVGELATTGWSSRTVTMDSTATTDYGNNANENENLCGLTISKNATLTWGTAAATAYNLRFSASIKIFPGGTMNMGTSATPCPRGSTQVLEFDTTANKQYSLYIMPLATFNGQGLSRTAGNDTTFANVTSSITTADTVINIDTATGWLSGDSIYISPTTNYAAYSQGTLSVDAGASTLTFTGGGSVTNHALNEFSIARAFLRTRSVEIRGTNSTYPGKVVYYGSADLDWVYLNNMTTQVSLVSGSVVTHNKCCQRSIAWSIYGNIFAYVVPAGGTISFTDHFVENAGSGNTFNFSANELNSVTGFNLTNVHVGAAGSAGGGASFGAQTAQVVNISGLHFYGFGSTQFLMDLAGRESYTITDISAYTGNSYGLWFSCGSSGCRNITVAGAKAYKHLGPPVVIGSNSGAGAFFDSSFGTFDIRGSDEAVIFYQSQYNCKFPDWNVYSCGASYTMPYPIALRSNSTSVWVHDLLFLGGVFNSTDSPYTTHTTSLVGLDVTYSTGHNVRFRGSQFGTLALTNLFTGSLTQSDLCRVSASRYNGDDTHITSFTQRGTLEWESTVYRTAAPSIKLTPASASRKLESGDKHIPLADGATAKTINVYVRRTAAYNGNQPRLRIRRNDAIGQITEATLATAAIVADDTWTLVTASLPVTTDDGVAEVYVDCDGTAGSIYVDDWSVS